MDSMLGGNATPAIVKLLRLLPSREPEDIAQIADLLAAAETLAQGKRPIGWQTTFRVKGQRPVAISFRRDTTIPAPNVRTEDLALRQQLLARISLRAAAELESVKTYRGSGGLDLSALCVSVAEERTLAERRFGAPLVPSALSAETQGAIDGAVAHRRPVVFLGEPGTGKTSWAHAVHFARFGERPRTISAFSAAPGEITREIEAFRKGIESQGTGLLVQHLESLRVEEWPAILAILQAGYMRDHAIYLTVTDGGTMLSPAQQYIASLLPLLKSFVIRLPSLASWAVSPWIAVGLELEGILCPREFGRRQIFVPQPDYQAQNSRGWATNYYAARACAQRLAERLETERFAQ